MQGIESWSVAEAVDAEAPGYFGSLLHEANDSRSDIKHVNAIGAALGFYFLARYRKVVTQNLAQVESSQSRTSSSQAQNN